MTRSRHYSPQISRFLVSALYHEAKRRKVPMTVLVNELITNQLTGSPGWITAQELRVAEESPPYISNKQETVAH